MDLNNKNTKEIIAERFETLPVEIQNAIIESNWSSKLRKIISDNNLRIDQGSAIETIVFLTMIGLISPNNFYSEIKKEAELSNELASKILIEIEREIFKEIKDFLIKIDQEESDQIEKTQKDPVLNRENILKEIEDREEVVLPNQSKPTNSLMIEPDIQPPSTQVNTPAQNQQIIQNDLNKSTQTQNTVAQKLQTPTVSAAKTVKVDPYREIPE